MRLDGRGDEIVSVGPRAKHAVGYLAIFAIALAVRGVYFLELASSPLFAVAVGDGRQYFAWALEIAGGNWLGEEAFYQAPLYPYVMAVLVRVFGPELWPIRLLQMFLGSASCVLVAVAARRFFSYPVGLIAGLMLAVYPPAIFFDGLIQKTSFSLFFTTALLALVSTQLEPSGPRRWVWMLPAGVALGALVLTRENALILLPVLGAWIVMRGDGRPERLRAVASYALGLALVLVPVAVRNLAVSGELLPTTSQLGANFFIGNNANADGRYQPLKAGREDARVERQDATALAEADLGRTLTPGEVSRYWLDRSFEYVRSEPRDWAGLMVSKASLLVNAHEIVDTENIEAYADESRWMRSTSGWFHWGVLGALALVGLWGTRIEWRRLWILYAMELCLAGSLVLFYVMARYRAPMIPIAIVFAAAGIAELYRSVTARAWSRVAVSAAIAAIAWTAQSRPLPIETYPRATTYYNVGVALYEAGEYEDARAALQRTLDLQPQFADGHFSLGNVLAASEESAEAMAHYREALALDPGHTDAALRLAHIYIGDGQLPKATATLEHALAKEPGHARAHNLLANIKAHQGDHQSAVTHYEAALAIDPRLADAHFKLGVLFSERGRLEAALRHLEETTRLLPDFAEGRLMLATVLDRLGRREEAELEHRRARELSDF